VALPQFAPRCPSPSPCSVDTTRTTEHVRGKERQETTLVVAPPNPHYCSADYYYNPEPQGDFNTTLVHVFESAKQLKIPYKWILLDSWSVVGRPFSRPRCWAMATHTPPCLIGGTTKATTTVASRTGPPGPRVREQKTTLMSCACRGFARGNLTYRSAFVWCYSQFSRQAAPRDWQTLQPLPSGQLLATTATGATPHPVRGPAARRNVHRLPSKKWRFSCVSHVAPPIPSDAQQNGGKFKFSDTQYNTVVPLEQEFWDFLLSTSKEWGLYTYEQVRIRTDKRGSRSPIFSVLRPHLLSRHSTLMCRTGSTTS
jgi:hypothetical protein